MKNLFITGKPKSGKSTLLENLIQNIENKKGFLTKEILENGYRTGFKIITYNGKEKILASTKLNRPYKISKYFVDIKGFEEILPEFFKIKDNEILYIDEIGGMELFSEKFKELVNMYLDAKNIFIATLTHPHYSDSFTKVLRKRKDIKIIEINPENREEKYNKILNELK